MPTSLLATSAKAATRSILIAFGMDHALIDFLARTTVGAATVLLAILFVAVRVPRQQCGGSRIKTVPLRTPGTIKPGASSADLSFRGYLRP